MTQAIPVPAFRDNYIWLIPLAGRTLPGEPGQVAVVDPGDAGPVIAALERTGLVPAAILITHHHHDHTGGVRELVRYRAAPVYGPAASPARDIDHGLREGDTIRLGADTLSVMSVPGHTLDHIAYTMEGTLLCGDTLFAGGCGRLFEGSAAQLYGSLKKISHLPDKTEIYCAHEYTVANLEFAREVEPENEFVQHRLAAAKRLRAEGRPTLPSTLAEERRTNPFLRTAEPAVRAAAARYCGRELKEEHEIFAAIRRWKDTY